MEAYLKDSVMVQVIRLLPEFGPHGRLVWEYTELWRVGPPLNARKLYRVMNEVLTIFKNCAFDFQRRRYSISRDGLARALQAVCNANLKGGLNNHNYLKKCAIAVAEEEAERRGKENERKLRSHEQQVRNEDRGPRPEVRPGVEGDPAGAGGAGNLGTLIKNFVKDLEGVVVPEAKEYDPTDGRTEADRVVDRSRGVMRPEREP